MKEYDEDSDDDGKANSSDDRNENEINLDNDWDRPKLPTYKIDNTIVPPLPLIAFKGVGFRSNSVITINGDEIKSIINNLSPNKRNGDCLQHLLHIRKLIRWFTARSYNEAAIRQSKSIFRTGILQNDDTLIRDIPVYKNTSFDGDNELQSGNAQASQKSEVDLISNVDPFLSDICKSNLTFDSNFESGNLFKAVRVTGRENINVTDKVQNSVAVESLAPEKTDQEYDLTLRNDINTEGNIQWYYYSLIYSIY